MNKPPAPPAVPKGWKVNSILPIISPAISGGGVSENLFKDMMAEMSGGAGGAPGIEGPSNSTPANKAKKDKKKGKS